MDEETRVPIHKLKYMFVYMYIYIFGPDFVKLLNLIHSTAVSRGILGKILIAFLYMEHRRNILYGRRFNRVGIRIAVDTITAHVPGAQCSKLYFWGGGRS